MKQMSKQIFSLALLCAFFSTQAEKCVSPYYSIRSQGVNLVRQVVGVRDIENELRCSDECWPGYIGSTFEFTKSFNPLDISHCLFGDYLLGNGCCQAFKVSGSGVEGRDNEKDLLADYFGLPTDFQSVININPRITNVIGDYQAYLRLDRWLCGLWFYIHAPVVHTKWNMHVCEDVIDSGQQDYPEGYFSANTVSDSDLLNNFSEFISGAKAPTIEGQTFNKLAWSRLAVDPCGKKTKTTLADLRFWIGYDWLNCDCYNLSVGLVVAAPTGNRPEACYLFEPIVGNGKHWELGGLVRGEYVFWEDCDQTHRVTGFTQANITHLFNAKQRRTFDLCGKPLSRYALAEKLGPNSDFPYLYGATNDSEFLCPDPEDLTNPTLSNYQFANEYTPVANLTTFCVNVSAAVQVDWVAMLTYSHCNFTWDLGYNLWYRSCENISFRDCDGVIPANTWALKGDAYVYGFESCDDAPFTQDTPVALAATQSNATIHAGTNNGSTTNAGIDNAQFAYGGDAATNPTAFTALDENTVSANNTRTSIQPVFLSTDDIDLCCARTKGFSNKIFTNVSYYWENECWHPYLGIGAEGEFGSSDKRDCKDKTCATDCATNSCATNVCNTSCDPCGSKNNDCRKCSLSQWGVWIKGGFVFG